MLSQSNTSVQGNISENINGTFKISQANNAMHYSKFIILVIKMVTLIKK